MVGERRLGRLAGAGVVLAVNLLLLAALLAALELLCSFFVRKPSEHIVSHERLNHTWRPNGSSVHFEWVADNPDFPTPYTHTYNRQGWLESHDVTRDKAAGTYRIIYLGDSFIEGTAPMEQSVPSIVERRLNARASGTGWTFEVVNTGTASYSPTLYYLLLRYVLLDYAPDVIVVAIDMTDYFDDWKYAHTLRVDEAGDPVAAPPRNLFADGFVDMAGGVVEATPWEKVRLFLFLHSYSYHFAARVVAKLMPAPARPPAASAAEVTGAERERWAWCFEPWSALTEQRAGRTLDLIARLVALARRAQVKVVITSVPHYWQYAGTEDGGLPPRWSDRPHREIAAVAEASGALYLDSFAQLKAAVSATPQSRYYYRGDMHFNPRGYALWADAHYRFLIDPRHALLPADAHGGDEVAGPAPAR